MLYIAIYDSFGLCNSFFARNIDSCSFGAGGKSHSRLHAALVPYGILLANQSALRGMDRDPQFGR